MGAQDKAGDSDDPGQGREHAPVSPGTDAAAQDPERSVLQEIEGRAGRAPRIVLHGSDSADAASPYAQPTAKDTVPRGRGNYQILGEIARGGMGTVLKGLDTDLGRDVALKVLHPQLALKPSTLHRFIEEAQIGGQLQHPGVVPVYELGLMADDRPYFTMKLVKGRTLSALLVQRNAPDEDRHRFLSIFESICQTVAYAHSKGVIHRDLKPANVMVGAFGEVQVVDWGLAKVLARGGVADEERALSAASEPDPVVIETVRSGSSGSGSDSLEGSVMGTPAYMSPEQAAGHLDEIDERSDVFALGAILCEILTGRSPYAPEEGDEPDGTPRTLLLASQAALEPALERLESCSADPELVGIARDCLAPARRDRPQNAEKVAARVRRFLASNEERRRAAELRAAAARVRTRAAIVIFAGLLIGVGLGVWGYLGLQEERERRAEEARAALDNAARSARALQAEGRHDEALHAVESARELIATFGGDEALERRARQIFLETRQASDEARERADREARNRAFAERLTEIRHEVSGASVISRPYAQAFREYGLNVTGPDPTTALSIMLASGIAEEFALALDDWARRVSSSPREMHVSDRLTQLAIDLDPHPLRRQMREAIVRHDAEALVDLCRARNISDVGPGALWVFVHALDDNGERDTARALLGHALEDFPDDFLLHRLAAEIAGSEGQAELALRHILAALSLHPESAHAHEDAAGRHFDVGDHASALHAWRRADELDPEVAGARRSFRQVRSRIAIGDYEGALAVSGGRGRARVRTDNETTATESLRLLARSRRGDLTLEELRDMERPSTAPERAWLAYALATHPEGERAEAQRALELVGPAAAGSGGRRETSFVEALAFVVAATAVERWADALQTIDDVLDVEPTGDRHQAAIVGALRAEALAGLGRLDEAHATLASAEREAASLTYSYPADWRPAADLLRFLRQARRAVER